MAGFWFEGTALAAGRRRRVLLSAGLAGCILLLQPGPLAAQSIVEALSAAYTGNPTLQAARAELRATNEAVPQALSGWRPTVQVTGSLGRQTTRINPDQGPADTATASPRQAALSVTQPVYRGGRTTAAVDRAEEEVRGARAQLALSEQNVLLRAATAYMDVWRDQAVLALNINNVQVLERQLQATRDRFEVGEITRTDVAQAESRLAGAIAQQVAAEGQLRASRAVFEEVIGLTPEELAPPVSLEGLPMSLQESVDEAERRNPQILAANFAERASSEAIRETTGELLPEVSIEGTLDVATDTQASSRGSSTRSAGIFAQLRVPIYQAGAVHSRVRQSRQVNSQRRVEVEEARRFVEQEAVASWEALQTARAQIVSFRSQVEAAAIALEGVREEAAVGARTTLDVLDQEQELLDAEVSLVSAERDEIVAGFRLLSAVGRLNAAELGLPVEVYEPEDDYRAVRDSWFGLRGPEE